MEELVSLLLKQHNGDYFAAARQIDKQYKRGILTESEMLERMDILAAKGIANHWEVNRV